MKNKELTEVTQEAIETASKILMVSMIITGKYNFIHATVEFDGKPYSLKFESLEFLNGSKSRSVTEANE
jgi:hypothetical protein